MILVILVILYLAVGVASHIYIQGNMCASNLITFPCTFPSREIWIDKRGGMERFMIKAIIAVPFWPADLIGYVIGYGPSTSSWVNPWK